MKYTYERFREDLLNTRDEPVLNYFGRRFYLSYINPIDKWYFIGEDGSNEQTFADCETLLDNAKIDGKLLSEIWDDIARSMGSDVKIALFLSGANFDIEEFTKKMRLHPTLAVHRVWWYVAFAEEEYDDLSIHEKAYEFAKIMEGKEDIINEKVNEFKNSYGGQLFLFIAGDHFNCDKYFSLPQNFITFIHKTNPIVIFRNNYDFLKGIINEKHI